MRKSKTNIVPRPIIKIIPRSEGDEWVWRVYITLYGEVPSKKNSKQVSFTNISRLNLLPFLRIALEKKITSLAGFFALIGTRPFLRSSNAYEQWLPEALSQLYYCVSFCRPKLPELFSSPEKYSALLFLKFYRKTASGFDYNNIGQAIQDVLVDTQFLKDDTAQFCVPIYRGYEKDSDQPRCEIMLEYYPYVLQQNISYSLDYAAIVPVAKVAARKL